MSHISVLLKECIDGLNIKEDGIYIDGTCGRGGHSLEIAKRLKNGHLYSFDKDDIAIKESMVVLHDYLDKVTLVHDDFRNVKQYLDKNNICHIDGMLLDLGVSSPQFDDGDRGFSYRFDSRLDMRMDRSSPISAYEVVNNYSYEQLVKVIFDYGEEKFAKSIVRNIEKQRSIKPIETTFELVDIIKRSMPSKELSKKGHPSKQTFQAIRIEVNQELEALKQCLEEVVSMFSVDGRFCIITFHSLEDRIVKDVFKKASSVEIVDKRIPLLPHQLPTPSYRLVNNKPIVASDEECTINSRSKSAKLRILERIKE